MAEHEYSLAIPLHVGETILIRPETAHGGAIREGRYDREL